MKIQITLILSLIAGAAAVVSLSLDYHLIPLFYIDTYYIPSVNSYIQLILNYALNRFTIAYFSLLKTDPQTHH